MCNSFFLRANKHIKFRSDFLVLKWDNGNKTDFRIRKKGGGSFLYKISTNSNNNNQPFSISFSNIKSWDPDNRIWVISEIFRKFWKNSYQMFYRQVLVNKSQTQLNYHSLAILTHKSNPITQMELQVLGVLDLIESGPCKTKWAKTRCVIFLICWSRTRWYISIYLLY